ncbi:MAG: alpha/beta hydrolase [Anaerolineae bacterium]|nr:alpha/beta hydrolase [Anaerolineae bacterium]
MSSTPLTARSTVSNESVMEMQQLVEYERGQVIAFTECGDRDGYPILIQHGLIASIRDYGLFDRLVKAGARVISIARPGYGDSSPYVMKHIGEWGRIVGVLVEELQLDQVDVLGMSSGAPYSYAIGYALPERVRNIFIFSGTPALYDAQIVARWPYPVDKTASMSTLQQLANDLFFANLSAEDVRRDDIRDSRMHDCFGIAQDFKLRCVDWGFGLAQVKPRVIMQHSRDDDQVPLVTAAMTAALLPTCRLEIREKGGHFSPETLDGFLSSIVMEYLNS